MREVRFRTLPADLNEPFYYLSARQASICQANPLLRDHVPHLPCWVPHRRVAEALGHGQQGIDNVLRCHSDGPYVWATEFENVHTFWQFTEPRVLVDGRAYLDCEAFYQAQKPQPFDTDIWATQRDAVMRVALEHKFRDPGLRRLLLATKRHPLISIKRDAFWGVCPDGFGQNRLGELLMELRAEFQSQN